MFRANSHLLSIDLDEAVDNELLGLSRTTRKQGSKYSNVQPPLLGIESHAHIRSWFEPPRSRDLPVEYVLFQLLQFCLSQWSLVFTRTSSSALSCSIIFSQHLGVHGHDGGNVSTEHLSPLPFADVFAVVGSCLGFGGPFLLEEGAGYGGWISQSGDVV